MNITHRGTFTDRWRAKINDRINFHMLSCKERSENAAKKFSFNLSVSKPNKFLICRYFHQINRNVNPRIAFQHTSRSSSFRSPFVSQISFIDELFYSVELSDSIIDFLRGSKKESRENVMLGMTMQEELRWIAMRETLNEWWMYESLRYMCFCLISKSICSGESVWMLCQLWEAASSSLVLFAVLINRSHPRNGNIHHLGSIAYIFDISERLPTVLMMMIPMSIMNERSDE